MYNVLQRRCQPRPTITCILGGGVIIAPRTGIVRRTINPRIPTMPERTTWSFRSGEGGRGGRYSFVAYLSNLIVDHAYLSRWSTVPTPSRDTFSIWALVTLLPYIT